MTVSPADQFSSMFRAEHRAVRDALLDLVAAFQQRDRPQLFPLLTHIAALTGPHFRYEEEALYPALVPIFGPEYISKLLEDHDRAIGTAKRLVAMAQQDELSAADVETGVRFTRSILPHVSDCDGLSIMVERLDPAVVEQIFTARERAREQNLDLLSWSDQVRGRPAIVPA